MFSPDLWNKSAAADAYEIDNSLRFNVDDSAYLSRVPAVDGDRKTWTFSCWFKKSGITGDMRLLTTNDSGAYVGFKYSTNEDVLRIDAAGIYNYTTAVYRDPSAWYHVVACLDTTQGVGADRSRAWINGTEVTWANPGDNQSLNADSDFNYTSKTMSVGSKLGVSEFDGYIAECYFLDGAGVTDASDFGELDSTTNQWIPLDSDDVKDAVTFGTNGFYQKYDNTITPVTSTTFPDASGEGHTITAVGDVTNSTAQSKVGDSSIYFDGTGDLLSVAASSDFSFGTGAWTIEMWLRSPDLSAGYNTLWSTDITSSSGWGGSGSGAISFGITNAAPATVPNFYFNTKKADNSTFSGDYDGLEFAVDTWYHLALTNAGSTGDVKVWIDGTLETTFETGGSVFGYSDEALGIGVMDKYGGSYRNTFNGYLDEIRISDTERYTTTFPVPTTEFTTDANTKLLIHSNYNAGLGMDSSGNGNVFAATNLVATDQVLDSPTNNFATINPLAGGDGSGGGQALSEGNLRDLSQTDNTGIPITFGIPSSGKWYFEWYIEDYGATSLLGLVAPEVTSLSNGDASAVGFWLYHGNNGYIYGNGAYPAYGTAWGVDGNLVGVAVDMDNGALYFSLNGTWQDSGDPTSGASKTGAAATDLLSTGYDWIPCFKGQNPSYQSIVVFNAGQDSSFAGNLTAQGNQDANEVGDFYYEPPSGFLALCTDNLSAPEIALPGDNFNTKLYTGDGNTTLAVSGVGFEPDFTWIKNRDQADDHTLVDSVRGATNYLVSNETDAEVDDSTFVASLDSDGFTVGDDVVVNTSTEDYASWNWKAGTSFDPDTAGTLVGSGSANSTAGFSIVAYTGNFVNGATFGHGLSQAPELVIVKSRSLVDGWLVGTTAAAVDFTDYAYLDTNVAFSDSAEPWNDTDPNPTVVSLGTNTGCNSLDETYVAYCFHSVEGYSKVGSYTGNGDADGTFVYCGFRPAWYMIRRVDSAPPTGWEIEDNKRLGYNVANRDLIANGNYNEQPDDRTDMLSNGFKIRATSNNFNNSGGTYLYLAFAESPFKYSNAR